MIFSGVILGTAIHKASNKIGELTEELRPLVGPAKSALTAVSILGVSAGFAQVVGGICVALNTYHDIAAQKELIKIHAAIAADVAAISKSLESVATNLEVMTNHQAQQEFAQHVLDFVAMRSKQESSMSKTHTTNYFFVYHHGNEWMPAFTRLHDKQPVHNLCGLFTSLDVLAAYLIAFRSVVGEHATLHILCPSTNLVFIDNPIALPPSIGPVRIEGELNNQTGKPYIYLNMPTADPNVFSHVCNTAALPIVPKQSSGWGRKIASTAAAWSVRLPAAIVATPGGVIGGIALGAVCAPLLPVAAVGGAFVGLAAAGGIAAGATAGVIGGLYTGERVEKAWDAKKKKK